MDVAHEASVMFWLVLVFTYGIQVLTTADNIARGRPTNQTGVLCDGSAEKGNDGNINGHFNDGRSCTHTGDSNYPLVGRRPSVRAPRNISAHLQPGRLLFRAAPRYTSGIEGHVANNQRLIRRSHGHDLWHARWTTPRSTGGDRVQWECSRTVSCHRDSCGRWCTDVV